MNAGHHAPSRLSPKAGWGLVENSGWAITVPSIPLHTTNLRIDPVNPLVPRVLAPQIAATVLAAIEVVPAVVTVEPI